MELQEISITHRRHLEADRSPLNSRFAWEHALPLMPQGFPTVQFYVVNQPDIYTDDAVSLACLLMVQEAWSCQRAGQRRIY